MQTARRMHRVLSRSTVALRSACLIAALSACSGGGHGTAEQPKLAKSALQRDEAPSAADLPTLGASNQAFAFDLYHQLAADPAAGNLLFSPYSISSALAMTYAGARGETESQIASALHFDLPQPQLHPAFNATNLALATRGHGQSGADGSAFALEIDNSLWAEDEGSVLPAFLDTLALSYGAGVWQVDFVNEAEGARQQINGWIDHNTHARVPELLPAGSLTNLTRFVLTNTVYLNAGWQTKFDANRTGTANFTRRDGSQVSARMMNQTLPISYASGDGFSAISLPYADDALQFVAILPDEGKHDAIEAGLSADWFAALNASWQLKQVTVSLPMLDYASSSMLNEPLTTLGMRDAFMIDTADLSGISDSHLLFIKSIYHQASLQVAEGGTIAAAATAVVIATRNAATLGDLSIRFERPFFLAVIDQPTGAMLFLGRVLDPTAK